MVKPLRLPVVHELRVTQALVCGPTSDRRSLAGLPPGATALFILLLLGLLGHERRVSLELGAAQYARVVVFSQGLFYLVRAACVRKRRRRSADGRGGRVFRGVSTKHEQHILDWVGKTWRRLQQLSTIFWFRRAKLLHNHIHILHQCLSSEFGCYWAYIGVLYAG